MVSNIRTEGIDGLAVVTVGALDNFGCGHGSFKRLENLSKGGVEELSLKVMELAIIGVSFVT